LIAKTRRLQRQALLATSPHVKTLLSRGQTTEDRRHPPPTANPPLSIHRSIRPAIGTTPTVEDAASAHSLFTLSKITCPQALAHGQTRHSRSLNRPSPAARLRFRLRRNAVLSRRKGAAAALRNE